MNVFENVACSIYKNAQATKPYRIPLLEAVTTPRWSGLIAQVRAGQLEKKALPLLTPSCLQVDGRGTRYDYTHTGFLAFDIDAKDNPYDPASIRAALAGQEVVAFAGLSASGRGVWGLVRIADPARHKEHFRALQEDFRVWGLVIDNACSDVVRGRFYSYDPDAHVNPHALTYERLPAPPAPRPRLTRAGGGDGFGGDRGAQVLANALRMIEEAQEGGRNAALTKAAYLAGGAVGAGLLSEIEAQQALEAAAEVWGNLQKDAKVIASAMRQGMLAPIADTPTRHSRAPGAWGRVSGVWGNLSHPTHPPTPGVVGSSLQAGTAGAGNPAQSLVSGAAAGTHPEKVRTPGTSAPENVRTEHAPSQKAGNGPTIDERPAPYAEHAPYSLSDCRAIIGRFKAVPVLQTLEGQATPADLARELDKASRGDAGALAWVRRYTNDVMCHHHLDPSAPGAWWE
jgi:hypothetical protein